MADAATGFAPVIDAGVDTLILGSFPGVASLGKAQYYAHPQNQFWRLVGAVIDEPLAAMEYAARTGTLLAHRIGLWDVLERCVRKGSLDADIRDVRPNEFARVLAMAPDLRRIFFNGKTAGKFEREFATAGFDTAVLPSSSAAYTLGFEAKLVQWRRLASSRTLDAGASAQDKVRPVAVTRVTPHASRAKC